MVLQYYLLICSEDRLLSFRSMKWLLPALLGFGIFTAVAPLQAGAIGVQTFFFTGTCTDCEGTGTGTLVLQDYVQGTTSIDLANLISFNYSGTNLLAPFQILPGAVSIFVVNIPVSLPGPGTLIINTGQFTITTSGQGLFVDTLGLASVVLPYFQAGNDGLWSAGDNGVNADFGTAGTFSVASVPEPSSLLLLGAGLAAVGLRLRKR